MAIRSATKFWRLIWQLDIGEPQPAWLWDEENDGGVIEPMEPDAAMPEADDFTHDAYDKYLNAEVLLPKGNGYESGKVVSRKRNSDGDPIGKSNSNPILDTRIYRVEFSDGHVEEFAANVIAECMMSQCDSEGRQQLLLEEIIDHRKDDSCAVSEEDSFVESYNGNKVRKRTTVGWSICVQWKGGETSWVPLKDLKEAYPVQLAEYAVANEIEKEPAFAWWVKDFLRRRDRILAKVKTRYWKQTHKFGIRMPKTVEEALSIDAETGTTFWRDAIEKEMRNVMPAFKILGDDEEVPVGYKRIPCHMVFDVKMDFTRKARLVAGGHVTDPPSTLTYSSVVSRDSVRIAFLIAALNGLDVCAADVGNAYLNAPTREKVYTVAGKEFGSHAGKNVLIVRALYGLKSSGAAWHAHLAQSLRDLGFTPCLADPDIWMKRAVKPDGFKYWEYLLVFVDDLLLVSHDVSKTMEALKKIYRIKEDSVGPPTRYLGATIKQWTINEEEGYKWGMSADEYVQQAVKNVEQELLKIDKHLSTRANTPISSDYRPELDVSAVLEDDRANYYQNLIGVLRWAVELGRIDIYVEVAMMSAYNAQPRIGHLEQLFHIFAYLKSHSKSTIVFDDNLPEVDESRFVLCDWQDFYGDIKEAVPPNAPEARGNSVTMSCFVDADHAGNRLTRRSHTGILVFLNRALITWYSRRQNTVETSTFGSEFIAMRTAVEQLEGLRYKLRMMGIEIDGATNVYCDNASVCVSVRRPESTLKKKHVSIAYHRVREAVAAGTVRVAKEDTKTNLADLLTKPLNAIRRKELLRCLLW